VERALALLVIICCVCMGHSLPHLLTNRFRQSSKKINLIVLIVTIYVKSLQLRYKIDGKCRLNIYSSAT